MESLFDNRIEAVAVIESPHVFNTAISYRSPAYGKQQVAEGADGEMALHQPEHTTSLNPAAWSDSALGTFVTGKIAYNDDRFQRRPQESTGLDVCSASQKQCLSKF